MPRGWAQRILLIALAFNIGLIFAVLLKPRPAPPELYEIEALCSVQCGSWSAGAILPADDYTLDEVRCLCLWGVPSYGL